MKKILKIIGGLLFIYIAFCLITPYSSYLRERSIKNQINYIQHKMILGEDNLLQNRYPEGKLFSNAIFALSVIKANEKYQIDNAAEIIDKCISELLLPETKNYFSSSLNLTHGAFYNGWTNFVLKKYLESKAFSKSKISDLVQSNYNSFSTLIIETTKDSFQLIETYSDAVWSGDNLACIASLNSQHDSLKIKWVEYLENESKDSDKLTFHVNSDRSEIRGSSQALSLFFIKNIHSEIVDQRNKAYQERFLKNRLGIQFIREYEGDNDGYGDIDSGPIILNFGAVATIMNIKTQAAMGDPPKFTWSFLNCLGMSMNYNKQKYYLFKKEMMFDIFMLWCMTEFN